MDSKRLSEVLTGIMSVQGMLMHLLAERGVLSRKEMSEQLRALKDRADQVAPEHGAIQVYSYFLDELHHWGEKSNKRHPDLSLIEGGKRDNP